MYFVSTAVITAITLGSRVICVYCVLYCVVNGTSHNTHTHTHYNIKDCNNGPVSESLFIIINVVLSSSCICGNVHMHRRIVLHD